MSVYRTRFHIREVNLSENGDVLDEFETDLPHHDFICKEMCKSWNHMQMERFYDGILKGRLANVVMSYGKEADGRSYGRITFTGKPGFRFTQKVKDEIDEQTTAQFSDGWGEGFFYPYNHMTAPDGVIIGVE